MARRDGRVETGTDTRGGHAGWELLEERPEEVAEKAARRALTLLDAVDAPTGRLPVVVGNGFGGVLLHEAVGHGLEADAVQKDASVYAGRLGDQLAPEFVTAYDDGSRPNAWGSEGVDDEGTPTRRTTVIEEGRLTSYLYDLLRARKDGVESTGNGRRESFRQLPIPRMTNTFFAPGDATPDELIGGVERGLYAVSFGGGQVEPATGDFVFGVSEGYLIENGKVTAPVRGATLVGNGLEALRAIDGIAGDLEIATGYCGKGGQTVPAGVGPAARAHPRADRRRHRVRDAWTTPRGARSRRPSPRARPTPRRGPRSRPAGGCACTRARWRASATRAAAAIGVRAFAGTRRGLRLRHRPVGRRRGGDRSRRARGGRAGGRGRVRGPARGARHLGRGRARLRRLRATGPPSASWSWRSRWTARRAPPRASPRWRTPSTRTAAAPSRSPTRAGSRRRTRPRRRGRTRPPSPARART